MPPNRPTPAALAELARRDPVLGAAMKRVVPFPGFPDAARRGSHFHALARAIIYQQLAGAAAKTIYLRVRALGRDPRFPTSSELLRLSDEALRGAGLSAAKVRALRDLAGRIEDGRLKLRSIGRLPDEEIEARLVEVRGIGRWTAQMFLLFKLGRLDVFPVGDLGVREGARRLDDLAERPTPAELTLRGEPWAPLRSVASWVLWRLCDPVPR